MPFIYSTLYRKLFFYLKKRLKILKTVILANYYILFHDLINNKCLLNMYKTNAYDKFICKKAMACLSYNTLQFQTQNISTLEGTYKSPIFPEKKTLFYDKY